MTDPFKLRDDLAALVPHANVEQEGPHISIGPRVPRCDFCSAESVTWRVEASDFLLETHNGVQSWSRGAWAACAACGDLVQANDWHGLIRRVAPILHVPRLDLLVLYAKLRTHITQVRRAGEHTA